MLLQFNQSRLGISGQEHYEITRKEIALIVDCLILNCLEMMSKDKIFERVQIKYKLFVFSNN